MPPDIPDEDAGETPSIPATQSRVLSVPNCETSTLVANPPTIQPRMAPLPMAKRPLGFARRHDVIGERPDPRWRQNANHAHPDVDDDEEDAALASRRRRRWPATRSERAGGKR